MPWEKKAGRDPRYSTKEWQQLRREHLDAHPRCHMCVIEAKYCPGRSIQPATQLDHIEPVFKAPDRFFDPTNLQALCLECHKRKSAYDRKQTVNPSVFTDFEGNKRDARTGEKVEMKIEPLKERKWKVY